MLTQALSGRGDSETRRRGYRTRLANYLRVPASARPRVAFIVILATLLAAACSSKPTDPRTVIPGDALVYLESTDLEHTLNAIVENPRFQQAAKAKPDLSALRGVKVSIAVTGFETSEQTLNDETSILKSQPRVVAVAETNAWEWQTSSFIENALGEFVNEVYPGEVTLDVTPRNDGKYYVWTSTDARKAYALQQGSLVFFGNDESAIERCQAVKRGELDSIKTNPKITEGDRLAFGYISPEGVGQIANLAGISLAIGASEEEEVKSFVARVLPEILRNSARELTWTATKKDDRIEDKVVISLDDESSVVLAETIVPVQATASELPAFVPDSAATVTRYSFRDPQVAWRSVVLTAGKKTDQTSGNLLIAFSGSLFEQYGIEEPEPFLSAVGNQLMTVKLTPDSEDVVVIATVKDAAKIKSALAKEISFVNPAGKQFGADVWRSDDGELAAAFSGDVVISGDAETVLKCLETKQSRATATTEFAKQFSSSDAVTVTMSRESGSMRKLLELFGKEAPESDQQVLVSTTETRFNRNGIERRSISDFGFIGSILERLAQE